MAYKLRDKGPYPNKAGEFCGNCQREKVNRDDCYIGRPQPCGRGTVEKMEAQGYVGLYLKKDIISLSKGVTEVPTPENLKEPPSLQQRMVHQLDMDIEAGCLGYGDAK